MHETKLLIAVILQMILYYYCIHTSGFIGGDSDCLRKMDREEEIIAKANSDLEKALKDVKPKAMEYTEAALKVQCLEVD